MRRIAVLLAFAAVAVVFVGGAGSATSKSTFQVFVEPTVTASSNGLTIETEFEGVFDAARKTASGNGSYEIKSGSTVLESGTLTLTRLVAFQFYGCGEVTIDGNRIPLPPDYCGGRAMIAFQATSSTGIQRTGLLEVNCQIHDPGGQAPPGTSEGVKVNLRGVNFNRHVTGDNLFVLQP
jgi:hypothetical protein